MLEGKVILITGGSGSFGYRAVRAFCDAGAARVIVYSRDEYKHSVMRSAFPGDKMLSFAIGDVRDQSRLESCMEGVDYVVHAAAMKQIPACEDNPQEAIATNVVGSRNVVVAAVKQGVDCVVNLSADKAVYSVSVYGATKFLAEKLFIEGNLNEKSDTRFVNLRYSNILDSRGGVFEIFKERLAAGNEAKVFGSSMTRFFLSQNEIAELCTLAFERSVGGETFVKLASPIRIAELATTMQKVIGNGSVSVDEGGARTGEKMDAVLLADEESEMAHLYEDMIVINNLGRPLRLTGLEPVNLENLAMQNRPFISGVYLESLVRESL